VTLPDGNVLFASITVSKSVNVNPFLKATNEQTSTLTSSQGVKNIFGYVLYKPDYTTTWTYDYDKVISSNSFTSVLNGLGWSYKGSSSSGPVSIKQGREHEWVGTAQFAMIVGGIDVSNGTLLNKHRVRYNGTYAWQYEQTS